MKRGFRIQFCFALLCAILVPFSVFSQSYGNVKIGKQIWMSKNLDVATFRNGDSIPKAINSKQWSYANQNKIPAYCYYNFNTKNGVKYGKLYNWYAVNDKRGLSPVGWRIPTDEDWKNLSEFLGGNEKAGLKLKSKTGWTLGPEPGREAISKIGHKNGDNTTGFTGLPGGSCSNDGRFYYIQEFAYFWSSTEIDVNQAERRNLFNTGDKFYGGAFTKGTGMSVRCLKE